MSISSNPSRQLIQIKDAYNNEILKYTTLNKENAQIEAVLNNLILSLDFENQDQFQEYLKRFNLSFFVAYRVILGVVLLILVYL